MPRLRSVVPADVSGVDVPVDLLDKRSKVWASVAATLKWFAAAGLDVADRGALEAGPATRHEAAASAWGVAAGFVNKWGQPHFGNIYGLGIPGHGGDVMEERLLAVGVRLAEQEGKQNG